MSEICGENKGLPAVGRFALFDRGIGRDFCGYGKCGDPALAAVRCFEKF